MRHVAILALLVLSSCAKPNRLDAPPDAAYLSAGLRPPTWQSDLAGGFLIASGIAPEVAIRLDQGDGAHGCIVGEAAASLLAGAGDAIGHTAASDPFGLGSTTPPDIVVDVCRCREMRVDWRDVEVPEALEEMTGRVLRGVGSIVEGRIRTCEGRAWAVEVGDALQDLVPYVGATIAGEVCRFEISGLRPDLAQCGAVTPTPRGGLTVQPRKIVPIEPAPIQPVGEVEP